MRELNRRDVVKGIGTAAMASLVASRPSHAAISDAILKGAEKEGAVLWYDGYAREDGEAVLREFQKAYPFIKNASYVELPSVQKQARLIQECLAGGPTTDVFFQNVPSMQQLIDRDFIHEVDWKALGVRDEVLTTKYMILIANAISCFVINTQKVKEADFPKVWDDLLDPKWKGRIGAWQRAAQFVVLLPAYGEEKTREYVRKLVANDPRLFPGSFQVAQAVGAGEIDIGVGFIDTAQRLIAKGAPIKMIVPEPVPPGPIYIGVVKFGKNPNAGKLLSAWLQTTEGALAFENATQRGLIAVPETRTAQLVKGKQQSAFTPAYELQNADKLGAFDNELQRILQGRS